MGWKQYDETSGWLGFEDRTPSERKTRLVAVFSRKRDEFLGVITWMPPWRTYGFQASESARLSPQTMVLIISKIEALMQERSAEMGERARSEREVRAEAEAWVLGRR